jgi:hypothetical protein
LPLVYAPFTGRQLLLDISKVATFLFLKGKVAERLNRLHLHNYEPDATASDLSRHGSQSSGRYRKISQHDATFSSFQKAKIMIRGTHHVMPRL